MRVSTKDIEVLNSIHQSNVKHDLRAYKVRDSKTQIVTEYHRVPTRDLLMDEFNVSRQMAWNYINKFTKLGLLRENLTESFTSVQGKRKRYFKLTKKGIALIKAFKALEQIQ